MTRCIFSVTLLSSLLLAADVPNISGKWRLNLERSTWDERPRPEKVEVEVQHNEPALKYSGSSTNSEGAVTRFDFDGAIDGKPYNGMTIKRINPMTTRATSKSADGKNEETITTTVARDGRSLTRRIVLKTPERVFRRTEIYERVN